MSKKVLRSKLLALRRNMTLDDVRQRSLAIQGRVRDLPGWEAMRTVLVHLSLQNEVDTKDLIHDLWRRGVKTLAPCCCPDRPGEMDLLQFQTFSELRPSRFNILEPDRRTCAMGNTRDCDAALVPGAGFDRQGFRLGFGGGYYDRLLPQLWPETLTIGLAYDFQLVDVLPREAHDHPMRVVCTDLETVWPQQ